MYLKRLSLTNFRTFSRLDIDLPRRILLLVGDNAQGKTSLLEAVYYLATFTSFHAQSDRQLINFMLAEEHLRLARLVADFERGERSHQLEVRLILENGKNGNSRFRKEILLDGIKRSMQEAIGIFNAVIFLPQMTRILEGGPEDRRKYLNVMFSQAIPGYARALSDYSQTITQRNALLKQLAERNGDKEQLTYWDDLLAKKGAILIFTRTKALVELEQKAARVHHVLTNSKEVLRIQYQPSFDPARVNDTQYVLPLENLSDQHHFSLEEIEVKFKEKLQALQNEEIARGITTIGPHRDEIRFLGNGVDLGHYGSRGQIRSALLSIKLAEVLWLKEKTNFWPVLLLDEIMAEFDTKRRAYLLKYLLECEQVLMTTTDLNLFTEEFLPSAVVFQINNGMIHID
ncbi:MAG: DNA replication/repair protein RecF [Anaerolineaceae bacterium]|nr:DNA replication/repair protein RecF [Anaerolineaceae bacterium]